MTHDDRNDVWLIDELAAIDIGTNSIHMIIVEGDRLREFQSG